MGVVTLLRSVRLRDEAAEEGYPWEGGRWGLTRRHGT